MKTPEIIHRLDMLEAWIPNKRENAFEKLIELKSIRICRTHDNVLECADLFIYPLLSGYDYTIIPHSQTELYVISSGGVYSPGVYQIDYYSKVDDILYKSELSPIELYRNSVKSENL